MTAVLVQVFALASAPVFQFLKIARKAHNLCACVAHSVGNPPKYHTDRVVKLRYSA
jgi:hypothetical protein